MIKAMKMRSVVMLQSRHLTINYKFTSVYASKPATVGIIWLGPRAFLSSVKKFQHIVSCRLLALEDLMPEQIVWKMQKP